MRFKLTGLLLRSRLVPMPIKARLAARAPLNPGGVSAFMLQAPSRIGRHVAKGVLVLNQVDQVLQLHPELKALFLLVERKGWHGPNTSVAADIKLVEDSSTLPLIRSCFPRAVLIEASGGDFVDEQAFRPLDVSPDFDVIQIACWSPRKRIELMIDAAARLPNVRFVHFGHFEHGGSADEQAYRQDCLDRARRQAPNIHFPYPDPQGDSPPPHDKTSINAWINRARIGLLTTHLEGHPRFKMECLAADRPMLIPTDTSVPTRKHVTAETGRLFDPTATALAEAIPAMLDTLGTFAPRDYVLAHSGRTNTLRELRAALASLAGRGVPAKHYDTVDWDGRNQNLRWGDSAMTLLAELLSTYRPLLPARHRRG
ncbi:hypothetical protein [Synoicihabitans lomoniglobus]|uniref:Glycosyltransferase family 1 protein n=1 Tax=Synoicihabitans lomoniglobus TaxID=2909285 RepID=A0AAE9ZZC1_9BACT|nr:hypothetical protein [Opitutaceae bacterium LMO-M01]WED64138.1 hypothetical protein PXH66_17510 [Opitutaceae bacterium LMO-M01]